MTNKISIALIFGGKSAEHSISLKSAKNILKSIDREKYILHLIGIDNQGQWLYLDSAVKLNEVDNGQELTLNNPLASIQLNLSSKGYFQTSQGQDIKVDIAFPILHGPFGEDGSIQGLFKVADMPYVGPDVLGSSMAMDKVIMKRLFKEMGLPVCRFMSAYKSDPRPTLTQIEAEIGLPCFVKPANMGSSVGITKVKEAKGLERALETAFLYDNKIILEENIDGRELEVAVIGNRNNPRVSPVGEIEAHHDFYSFDSKYIDQQGATATIPANIPKSIAQKAQNLALAAYKAIECEGLSRVDIFYDIAGALYVNEINTIPGFTSISMYPMLMEATGLTYTQLIDELVQHGLDRAQRDRGLSLTFVG